MNQIPKKLSAQPPVPDPELVHWQNGSPKQQRLEWFVAWMFSSGIFLGFWIGYVVGRLL